MGGLSGGLGGFGGLGDNSGTVEQGDTSSAPKYNLKRYFKALGHKDTMSIGWSFFGSIVLPGSAQIYNRDYWKLPILYGGVAGMMAGCWYFNSQYQKTGNKAFERNKYIFIAGAALFYWASLIDGAARYKDFRVHNPGRAAIYSALLPGLGQIYNKEYWKLPIYYGGLAVCGYFWYSNQTQYERYRKQYIQAVTPGGGYSGSMSVENLKYYRDLYRRYWNYSIVATVAVYALQIIDADVFATMGDFDVNNSITMNLDPAIIPPLNSQWCSSGTLSDVSYGLALRLTF